MEAYNHWLQHDNDNRKRAALSYAIRQQQSGDEPFVLLSETVERILKNSFLPSPYEQANNLLLWIGRNQDSPGKPFVVKYEDVLGFVGAMALEDIFFLVRQLRESSFLENDGTVSQDVALARLTLAGWEKVDEIERGKVDSRRAFMAMEYDDTELDGLLENNWKPAVKKTGYELYPLSEKPVAGSIMNSMRNEIRKSRFVLADLTYENRGAYWEAGYAEGLGKPVIYLCEKEQFETTKTHFDVNQQQTVVWDREHLEAAEKQLKLIIRNTLPTEAKLED
jgi:nucleoside 2-deoxyribosyltransferase